MKYQYILKRLAALSLGCFFLFACTDEPVIDTSADNKLKLEVSSGVESYLSQNGKIKAKLVAEEMVRALLDSPFIEFPDALYVEFFNDSGAIETILTAKYAKYREYESKILLRDSVVVINIINEDTLRTNELWWDQTQELFYTEKPARITKKDGTIANPQKGLKAKQDLSWYEFYSIKNGQLPIPPDNNDSIPPPPEQ
jgi:LPS export ABC transporter protein LptC